MAEIYSTLTMTMDPPMTFRMFKLLTQLNQENTSQLCALPPLGGQFNCWKTWNEKKETMKRNRLVMKTTIPFNCEHI